MTSDGFWSQTDTSCTTRVVFKIFSFYGNSSTDTNSNWGNSRSYFPSEYRDSLGYEFGWGFQRAQTDNQKKYQIQAEREQSRKRNLHNHYVPPVWFCIRNPLKPRVI